MNCRKVSHLLSAYMDGELPGVEHRIIHQHLGACAECRCEYEGLLRLKRMLSAMRVQEAECEMPERILQRIAAEESKARALQPGSLARAATERWRNYAPAPPVLAFATCLLAVGVAFTLKVTEDEAGASPATMAVGDTVSDDLIGQPSPSPVTVATGLQLAQRARLGTFPAFLPIVRSNGVDSPWQSASSVRPAVRNVSFVLPSGGR